jgi:hypothetical protein
MVLWVKHGSRPGHQGARLLSRSEHALPGQGQLSVCVALVETFTCQAASTALEGATKDDRPAMHPCHAL